MEIVINMSKADFDMLKGLTWLHKPNFYESAILNGTVLPEHYGDLIDREELLADTLYAPSYAVRSRIYNAKTIVPATETKEPARTRLDCYKCKNNKADISCAECHFELATEEKDCENCKYEEYSCLVPPCNACYMASCFESKEGDGE